MRIGIIGAGPIGATLALHLSKVGHAIKVTNESNKVKLEKLANETGAIPSSLTETIQDIELLVVAVPLVAIPALAITIKDKIAAGTVIIDTTNYYPIRDGIIGEIENGMPESVWVSAHLGRPVIKVFNSILSGSFAHPNLNVALPLSGDDTAAKKLVGSIVKDCGFDKIDIGNLGDSWQQQPGSEIYCTDLTIDQIKSNLPFIVKDKLPARRELALQFILQQDPADWKIWWKECVRNNRKVFETLN